jgi:hypothetical protein
LQGILWDRLEYVQDIGKHLFLDRPTELILLFRTQIEFEESNMWKTSNARTGKDWRSSSIASEK